MIFEDTNTDDADVLTLVAADLDLGYGIRIFDEFI